MNSPETKPIFGSWKVALVLCCLFISLEAILSFEFIHIAGYEQIVSLRIFHLIESLFIICAIMALRDKWNSRYSLITIILLYLPTFALLYLSYFSPQLSFINMAPFNFLKIHFMLFPFLRLGNYRTNFILICVIFLASQFIWFFSSMQLHLQNGHSGEPYLTITFFVVSLALLFSRAHDDKTLNRMTQEIAQLEIGVKTCKILITLKDRNNSPLQSILIANDGLSKINPDNKKLTDIITRNLERIMKNNETMSSIEIDHEKLVLNEQDLKDAIRDISELSKKSL